MTLRKLLFAALISTSALHVPISKAQERLRIGRDAIVLDQDAAFKLFDRDVVLDPLGIVDHSIGGKPLAEDVDQEYVEDLIGDLKMNFVVRRSTGLRNGFAVIYNGERYIVYDPMWFGMGRSYPDNDGSALLTLGHEVGHHVCGHTVGKMKHDPWGAELEADRFSGAAARRMGLSPLQFHAHLSHQETVLHEQGSDTHPPRALRIKAFKDGYAQGSSC